MNFWNWLARPYRLVTIGLSIVIATIFFSNVIFSGGVFDSNMWGTVVSWVAALSFVLMSIGLGAMKQRMVEAGLLLSSGVLIIRLALIAFEGHAGTTEFWFTVAFVIISVGAYMLESMNAVRHPIEEAS